MAVRVFGNATLDLTYRTARAPAPGETVLASSAGRGPGGKGFNQALAAHVAGAEIIFTSARGDDEAGAYLAAEAARLGLSRATFKPADCATDVSIIVVGDDGENVIVSTADSARSLTPADAQEACGAAQSGDSLLVQGNLLRETTATALRTARQLGLRTIANPAPIDWDWAGFPALSDILIVNRVEAEMLGGRPDPESASQALIDAGAGTVVVTLGADGVLARDGDGLRRLPASQAEAVDTTGAGDMVAGALAARLDSGRPLDNALEGAMRLAALTVERPGAAASFPGREEARRLLSGMGLAA